MKSLILLAVCVMALSGCNEPNHITELYKNSIGEGNLIATFASNVDYVDLANSNCSSVVETINKTYPNEIYICKVVK